ncbi:subtilisin-like protease SBT1.7 [Telopea speciosissima]|uniref:subtilisin-like protease SBT1.7 n=1 Tax=Telopea speciosissima TaxID=54955 RepID=UPI001CC78F5C|nr:subtilisin-like protease SBT1.7 [Telopea speciosissima]
MATRARIAAYKVCWKGGCFDADIMAGIDKAIEDGVNVISMSLGGSTSDYYRNTIAVGTFAAMERGIIVSCSAGNDGPDSSTVSNVAPWITTVGAGTLDRDFPAYVTLGNGKNFSGVSLYSGNALPDSLLPLIYARDASIVPNESRCLPGTLLPSKVSGKIVLCEGGSSAVRKGNVVKQVGGAGMILANLATDGEQLLAQAHLLPATAVSKNAGDMIKEYISSDSNPTATIVFQGTKVGIQPSPVVAQFSSRGPNSKTPEILKPDMIAPGVNILAGWSGAVGPTGLDVDTRRVEFNIISGTSMSCPHVSGIAALLKAAKPDWSPGAIRSALMTTAYTTYSTGAKIEDIATGKAATPFDYGAGHVDPSSALDPGLIYDLAVEDYNDFLCALNYSKEQISLITKGNFTCDTSKSYSVTNLNYPSFAVQLSSGSVVKHTRTLTNVGSPATYKVSVSSETESVKISVQPESLTFSAQNEKQVYTVTFTATSAMTSGTNSFGRLEWSDGEHIVGSPIAFSWK